ncbi:MULTISPECIES: shikimate kinase [Brevibacillus]|jgi:shikimate kinase|uniref:shikimate kinase n=1 Tax=Brevibacillus TaxID=55080 RepID=UPI000F0971EB|nr:shikimate kinase [Brevibacillus borstelensis]MBE5394687.1 shikimate kinase [Brevibacillus borstelensis]MCM3589564.1 shikimate kinase [Brevibacillus borstelensis]MCM3620676.1 shikimate kinase [Brevibacillus borstelensis]MED1875090.1 shikimate kinase [Brevibacillus borstelensis]MED1882414.1 shikimate kinase [Brevibacillus borstelensis]
MRNNLILVGFMGTGKTTVGAALSEELGMIHRDLDEAIVERAGCTIPQLFEQKGEAFFRDMEAAVLADLLKQHGLVLTTGGGAVLRAENVQRMLEGGLVVALSATEEELVRRLERDQNRPLLAGGVAQRVKALLEQRKDSYTFAPVQIDTTGKEVAEIVAEIRLAMVEKGLIGKD